MVHLGGSSFKKISSRSGLNSDSTFEEDNIFGEKEKINRLIIMDNVSGLADMFNHFPSFLAV